MRLPMLMAIVSVCFSLQSSFAETWYAPRVGYLHPEFTLPRIDDRKPVSLQQYRGRKVLLIQFASW